MIEVYTIKNDYIVLEVLNYGAAIHKLKTMNKYGVFSNIVLSYECLEDYLHNSNYLGVVTGPCSGRIANGHINIKGKDYFLELNDNNLHHLHGGSNGFAHRLFSVRSHSDKSIELVLTSDDSVTGYPGLMNITVKYELIDNELLVEMHGYSSCETVIDMAQHSYFNLSDNNSADVLNHFLFINTKKFLKIDNDGMVTDEIGDENDFDYTSLRQIKDNFISNHEQLELAGGGIDHPFLNNNGVKVELHDAESGRVVEIESNQDCVVIYTANKLNSSQKLLDCRRASKYMGICFEFQCIPNNINMNLNYNKPKVEIDKPFNSITRYRFTTILG